MLTGVWGRAQWRDSIC